MIKIPAFSIDEEVDDVTKGITERATYFEAYINPYRIECIIPAPEGTEDICEVHTYGGNVFYVSMSATALMDLIDDWKRR